jgi:hypothetical protein
MGAFYANVAVRTENTDAIIHVVRETGLAATVAANMGHVVVADQRLDDQDDAWMNELTVRLSAATGGVAVGVINHDDSVLLICLADEGKTVLHYNSCPDYFTGEGSSQPAGGDIESFSSLAPGVDREALDKALNTGLPDEDFDDYAYTFETDRHRELTQLLNLPTWTVLFRHSDLADFPPQDFDPSWIVFKNQRSLSA